MPRRFALLFLALATCLTASAQYAKTMHETFPVRGVDRIELHVVDSVTVEFWPANVVLIQTDVRVTNSSQGLFRYLTEEDRRYVVTSSREGATLNILSEEPLRRAIETGCGQLEEKIHVKVLLPKDFVEDGAGSYVLAVEEAGS